MIPPDKLNRARIVGAVVALGCLTLSFPFAKTLALSLYLLSLWADTYSRKQAETGTQAPDVSPGWMGDLANNIMLTVVILRLVEYHFDEAYPSVPLVPAFVAAPILIRTYLLVVIKMVLKQVETPLTTSPLDAWQVLVERASIIFTLFCIALVHDYLTRIDSQLLTSIEYTMHWLIWVFMGAAGILSLVSGVDQYNRNLKGLKQV